MTQPADRVQPTARLVRPYVPTGTTRPVPDPGDPGPVPPEPDRPVTEVLVVGRYVSVGVTRNVGHTGLTGLSVTRGDTSVTVALPPPTVNALCAALQAAAPVPYLPAGGDLR